MLPGAAMPPPLRFGVAYDFRNPPESGRSNAELYAAVLAQAERVDRLGYDLVWITEHHFVADGYLPSFVAAAGALAARTHRVRISSDVLLLPFQHPLRLAEDLAVLDNLSGGRIELGVGMGYAPHEFRAFGISRRERVSRTEEGIEVLRRAWSGEPFDFRGRHWSFEGASVRPQPVQPGGPPLWLAAMSEAGARRAARLGLHLLPQGDRRLVLDPWRAELERAGRRPEDFRVGIIRPWLVTDDRARDWPAIREAERYKGRIYADWIRESGDAVTFTGGEGVQPIPQTWILGSAGAVRAELAKFVAEYGLTDVVTWGVPPGLAPEAMDASLERFARDVLPAFR
jgi:alkanesulfonate monooxygenase SsuD/methylene tetrahydromethanopterin reductase-like flavin-dependent oxidoreductase (luciferase family)